MKTPLAAALLFLSTVAAAAAPQTVTVQAMKRLDVSGNFQVEVSPGPAGLSIDAAEGAGERVGVDVRPDGVRIWDKCVTFCNRRHDLATIRVTSPDLESLSIAKGVEARVSGLSADALTARASMGADLSMDGRCGALSLDASMGASVKAGDLQCRTATVHAAMGADVTVYASERLDGDASMGANIKVVGDPAARNTHAGMGGSIER